MVALVWTTGVRWGPSAVSRLGWKKPPTSKLKLLIREALLERWLKQLSFILPKPRQRNPKFA
jgi:hypothetical protein